MASLNPKSLKRFIAGAVCPQCQVVDKIYTLNGEHGVSRNCADCDFSEQLIDLEMGEDGTQIIALPNSE
ncbi:MAG: putative metal-binding protein (TIGR02443 family) [Flavobacterium sp.]|jgi:uncharacterized metal-binding protein (TIGR02443 family)